MKCLSIILSSVLFVGCHSRASDSVRTKSDQLPQQASVVTINATLKQDADSALSGWVSQRLAASHSLIRIQMLNNLEGWAATSEGTLFTTDDSQIWRQVKTVRMPKDAYLTDSFFLDSATGWVSLSRSEVHFDENTKEGSYDVAAWLINTADQGRTWHSNFTFAGAQILQILFVNDREGWAVGRRLSRIAGETDSNFVIRTTDQGKSWQDVSDKLPGDIGVYKVAAQGGANVTVITGKGFLYSTSDGGTNWHRTGSYTDEYNEIAVHQLEMNIRHQPCVLSGSGGLEGTISVLACGDANNSWSRHVLGGVFLNDVIFLPDGKVLACGFIARGDDPIGVGGEAAILISSDEGRNWSVVYRNPEVKSLNALALRDENHIWAVGGNGLVVRLASEWKER